MRHQHDSGLQKLEFGNLVTVRVLEQEYCFKHDLSIQYHLSLESVVVFDVNFLTRELTESIKV